MDALANTPTREGAGDVEPAPLIQDRYELLQELARGAMGTVYRARHRTLQREVAIKIVHPHLASSRPFVSALLREARAAAQVEHPHVARAIDFDHDAQGRCFVVMELVDGESLAAVLVRTPQPPDEWSIAIAAQVLGALGAAHARGIVHRDIKPANVMVQRAIDDDGRPCDRVKVCDFGIARLHGTCLQDDSGRPMTLSGTLCGTPGYVAPEQLAGRQVDARADLYSVGAMLYEMVTGHTVYPGELALALDAAGQPPPPARPSAYRPELAPDLERVILRALHPDPAERHDSAHAMRAQLLACLPGATRARGSDAPALEAVDRTFPSLPAPPVSHPWLAPVGEATPTPTSSSAPAATGARLRLTPTDAGAIDDEQLRRLHRRLRRSRLRPALYAAASALLLLGTAALTTASEPPGWARGVDSVVAHLHDPVRALDGALRHFQEVIR